MQGKLRHVGVMSKNLQDSLRFYQMFGFRKLSQRPSVEIWHGENLKIQKMVDGNSMIELVEGNWMPHLALTLTEGTMDDLWEKVATKAGVVLEFKKTPNLEIFYLIDPSGNYVEVVRER